MHSLKARKARAPGATVRFVSRWRRPYYEHESRSISIPEIKLSESGASVPGMRLQQITDRCGIIAVRYVTVRAYVPAARRCLSVNVDRTRGRCARTVLIIGQPYINSRAVLTSVREFDPVTRQHSAFARVCPRNDPISVRRAIFLFAFEMFVKNFISDGIYFFFLQNVTF